MTDREILLYHSLKGLHLLAQAPKLQVVSELCGLQAQFSRNPQISLRLRACDYAAEDWDAGLLKTWTHRGTIHVIRADELGLYLSAAGQNGDYRENHWMLTSEEQHRWAPFIRSEVLRGNDTRDGLKQACAAQGMSEELAHKVFYGWGGLIKEMCWRGELACCTGTDKRYLVPQPVQWTPRDDARRILIRRYFEHFGPATRQDCLYFLGYPLNEVKALLDEVTATLYQSKLDGKTYYHAAPLETEVQLPECVLLPGFDQLVLGYRDRSRFLDAANARKLTNVAGIVFPAVLIRGRLRARWKLEDEQVLVTPFERLYKKDEAAIRRCIRRKLGRKVTVSFADTE